MIYKIGFAILGILLFAWGNAYLFNHVDPWLATIITAVGIVLCVGYLASVVIKIFKQQNDKE